MPIVSINISPQPLDKKTEMAEVLSTELSRITNIPKERFIVLFNELPKDNISVGGKLLSELHK